MGSSTHRESSKPAERAEQALRQEPVRLRYRFFFVCQSDGGLKWGCFPRRRPFRSEREVPAWRPDSLAVQADLFIIPAEGAMGKCVATLMCSCGAAMLRTALSRRRARLLQIRRLRAGGGIDKTRMACQDSETNTELIDTDCRREDYPAVEPPWKTWWPDFSRSAGRCTPMKSRAPSLWFALSLDSAALAGRIARRRCNRSNYWQRAEREPTDLPVSVKDTPT